LQLITAQKNAYYLVAQESSGGSVLVQGTIRLGTIGWRSGAGYSPR